MAGLADFRLAPDPRRDPAGYPGDRLPFDFLLDGDRIDPLPADPTPVLERRHAVVAFGSNAAPAQLVAKFGSAAGPIAVTRARVRGFALGHSPHVSIPGYLPWVLVHAPRSQVRCALLWLDDRQRAVLDATEPNYHLAAVDPVRYPLATPATGPVTAYAAYRGRWGALRWPGDERPAGATTQAALFERLGTFGWFRDLIGAVGLAASQRRLAADADLRERVHDALTARQMVVPDGWSTG